MVGQIKGVFAQMKEPVQILFFGSEGNCDYCGDTHQLLEEVAAIDSRIGLSKYDLTSDAEVAKKFSIDKAPGIVIAGKDGDQVLDFGIQYSGVPSGHEFSTLINDIILVSGRDSGLSPAVREYLKKIDKPLHMQVFVTPHLPILPARRYISSPDGYGKPGYDPRRGCGSN